MYNKIFTKILDSSIWMEPTPTRIVWVTLLAAMDEDGFVQFAGIPNLAHRAVLGVEETTVAVQCLEAPDANSSDPDHEGRRIERVQGGWIVLNAPKYRSLVTREVAKEQTRLRVQRFRDKQAGRVTKCNGGVTPRAKVKRARHGSVTPSEAEAEAEAKTQTGTGAVAPETVRKERAVEIYEAYPRRIGKPLALASIKKALASPPLGNGAETWPDDLLLIVQRYATLRNGEEARFTPNPATWFNQRRFEDDPSTWKTEPAQPNGNPHRTSYPANRFTAFGSGDAPGASQKTGRV